MRGPKKQDEKPAATTEGFDFPPTAAARPSAQSMLDIVARHIGNDDPVKLLDELEKNERVGREASSVLQALDDALRLAIVASRLRLVCSHAARSFSEVELPLRESEIRNRARDAMPEKRTADGKGTKAPTAGEIEDFVAANYGEEVSALRTKRISLDEMAEHADRVARAWAYRARTLETIAAMIRATGPGVNPARFDE